MIRSFVAAGAVWACVGPALADVVSVPASADTVIYSESDSTSSGAGNGLFCGRTNMGFVRRTLMRFDLEGRVPPGSIINSVEVRVFVNRAMNGTHTFSLHAIDQDWGEGLSSGGFSGAGAPAEANDATWAYRFYDPADPPSSPAWSSAGADYQASPSASTTFGSGGFRSWSSAILTSDVQFWLDNPESNFGWIMIGDEGGGRSAIRFVSREWDVTSERPELVVDFTPPAGVGACCFPDGSCGFATAADCATAGGVFSGVGTNCQPNLCPPPTGACCLPDGSCVEDTEGNCIAADGLYQGNFTDCGSASCDVVLTPYADAMPTPPVAQPYLGQPGGFAFYNIATVQADVQVHSELPPTTMWTYEGVFPGPTIEAASGAVVNITYINDLRDENGFLRTDHLFDVEECIHGAEDVAKTVTHLHGGHVPAVFDGHPEFTFLPGDSEEYLYPNNQPASTLWYHDHSLGITRLNVYAGLAGMYIIRDANENGLGLPSGEYELPLVVMDRTFNQDGSLRYPTEYQGMFFGQHTLVNGVIWPFLDVDRAKYRFRILNAANSRTYTFSMSDGTPFELIGVDGGLLETSAPLTEITLAPAERADVIIDFSSHAPGAEVLLENSASAPFGAPPGVGVVPEVMKFVVGAETGPAPATPGVLREIETLEESDARVTREFRLEPEAHPCGGIRWLINGLHWGHITEFVRLGDTEVWEFVNPSGMMHPMHVHLVFFQVLDRQPIQIVDGEVVPTGPAAPPGPTEEGWKDTVKVNPGERVRVIARFEDYDGTFVYHCHILEHEDHEMMRQFVVEDVCAADLAEPFGQLDFSDIVAFLNAFGAQELDADLAPPFGQWDFSDVIAFLAEFASGCP